jgi:hypothetical protein
MLLIAKELRKGRRHECVPKPTMFLKKQGLSLNRAPWHPAMLLITRTLRNVQRREYSLGEEKSPAGTHDPAEREGLRRPGRSRGDLYHVEINKFSLLALEASFIGSCMLLQQMDFVGIWPLPSPQPACQG